ncbi:hypothetical protein [Thalassotalea ganghwensis]
MMTSIKRSIIKPFIILVAVVAALGVSATSISKQSQLEKETTNQAPLATKQKRLSVTGKSIVLPTPKSSYERKLKRQVLALLPGERHFNQRFLAYVLTAPVRA